MESLQDKHFLLTGASMGIGEALAREMATQGSRLTLVARNLDLLEKVRLSLPRPELHRAIRCDVTSSKDVETLARELESKGSLDGIVHNAGGISYESFADSSEEAERALFELNYFSILRVTRRLLPLLEQGRSSCLILISSAASWRALPLWSAYCASKAALTSWGESVRSEFKPKGIRVLTVFPGVTRTGLSDHAPSRGPKPFSTTEGKGMTAEAVARRIVRAYEKGRRDDFVGIFNRVYRLASFLFPGFLDRYFEGMYRKKGWLK